MPFLPSRVCSCGRLVPAKQQCSCKEASHKEAKARSDKRRPNARKRGYDSKWDKARIGFLAKHPNCTMCGQPAKVLDHIIPHRGDKKLFGIAAIGNHFARTVTQAPNSARKTAMTIPTFNPPMMPSPGLRNKPQIKILRAEFGDGYTQHTRDGLNHIREMISLRWDVLSNDERDQIISFFKERGGDQPFYWTPPGYDEPIKFTCAEWSTTAVTPQYFSIDAEFRQEFLA